MKKAATGALLAGITVLSLSAPAAQAATRSATDVVSVQSASFCIYEDSSYKRGHYCVTPSGPGFQTISLSGKHWTGTSRSANNAATSMTNGTGCKVTLHDTPYYGSKTYKAKAHSNDTTFRNNSFNDKASQIVLECP